MTIKKYPNYLYEIVNLGGEAEIGTYSIIESGEMDCDYATVIFYRTDLFTDEEVRFRFVRSNVPSLPVYSDWIKPAKVIPNFVGTQHWMGRLKFPYDRQQMTAGTTVRVFLETQNYVHVFGGTQIGAIMNYINKNDGTFDVRPDTAAYKAQFLYR